VLVVDKPSTVYVKFTDRMPYLFLLDSTGEGYYFRYLDGKTPRIKFNIPDPGNYETNVPIEIVKIAPIEIPDKYPTLPPANRDRWREVSEVYNPDMDKQTTTPIRIYSNTGVIEYGDRFLNYIKPIQKFLKLHEIGHLFYVGESDCDMYALINFIRMGYNQSTAYYALSHILSRNAESVKRLKSILNNIQKLRA
jgi:hypothetical protein